MGLDQVDKELREREKMMFNKLMEDIKQAMLDKDNVKRDCLRSVVSEIKN